MSVLMYVVGGVSIAVGALTAAQYLLSLASGPAGPSRLRRWSRISPAAAPRARRTAWNELGIRLGAVLTGTLLVLSVGDAAIGRLSLIAVSALLAWQLALPFLPGPARTRCTVLHSTQVPDRLDRPDRSAFQQVLARQYLGHRSGA